MRINFFTVIHIFSKAKIISKAARLIKFFCNQSENKPKPTENKKSGILDMSIPDTPEKVNNKPFPVSMPDKIKLTFYRR